MKLETELSAKGFKGWLRNPVRKDWSLGVPYDQTGMSSVMYPDFLVFRSGEGGGVFVDILEPHAPNQGDLAAKLQGLCRFGERHGSQFGRIELILVEGPKGKERLLRLDVNDPDIRDKAKILTENTQVVALARELNR
jgi:type III restriction enzyme